MATISRDHPGELIAGNKFIREINIIVVEHRRCSDEDTWRKNCLLN